MADKQKHTPGAVIMTRSVFQGQRKARWVFREKAFDRNDTGWRIVGDGDTQGYINHEENILLLDLKTIEHVEPIIMEIIDLPIGTELELHDDEEGKYFTDTTTGERIKRPGQE